MRGQLQRCGAERRGGEAIPDEGGSQVHGTGRVALGRGVLCEVARKHRGRRHESEEVCRGLAQSRALERAEEEHSVGGDRTAQRPAVLIAAETIALALTRSGIDRVEWIRRVEPMVANELEEIAVQEIGARLGHDVDRRARVHPVVRVRRACLELEFLQCVRKRQR